MGTWFPKGTLVAASVPSLTGVGSGHIVNGTVYNQAGNEGTMYSAPSPFDEPTKPIDVQTLRAWWVHQRNETEVIEHASQSASRPSIRHRDGATAIRAPRSAAVRLVPSDTDSGGLPRDGSL